AVLSVPARRAVHDAGIHGRDRVVTDAQRVDDTWTEALDEDVDAACHPKKSLPTRVGLQIYEHAPHPALAAVRVERWLDEHAAALGHRSDLHHVSAVVGEPARRAGRR